MWMFSSFNKLFASSATFHPPKPPSYSTITDPETNVLSLKKFDPNPNVEIVKMTTNRKQCIVGMLVRNSEAKLTLLFSHGNGSDMGQMYFTYLRLSHTLKVNVFGYDYSGYGESTGQPSEKNTYADIEACLNYLLNIFKFREEEIVLYGQSIGSGPTVDLAKKRKNIAGVILHSPFLSFGSVLFELKKKKYYFDIFRNVDKIGKIDCPVFIIHGTDDHLVNISHGKKLAELCKHPFDPFWVDHGGHNNLEMFPVFFEQLEKFVKFLEQSRAPS